ncbi:MAG: hypothetical protein EZS28_046413 [Streblomastix strix]|uniref:Uncharacterized protein n=1 Tax=Streblomastix strix TaxID=222440 RepID=A0A5J4TIT2_9EUKA|nr:MAG: hypothetical protein EZS28_046413 [Streblomastix strix]
MVVVVWVYVWQEWAYEWVEYYYGGWQSGEGREVMDNCAGVDGDWFGSNPLVGFETEPEPINHSTVF